MRSKNVPKEMQARIRKYIQFTLDPEKRSQLDENSFFKCLSKNLKGEIVQFINGNIINQYQCLSSFSTKLIHKLPFFLNEQIYGPEEMIIIEGIENLENRGIYFIQQGVAKACLKSTETDLIEFKVIRHINFFNIKRVGIHLGSLDFFLTWILTFQFKVWTL